MIQGHRVSRCTGNVGWGLGFVILASRNFNRWSGVYRFNVRHWAKFCTSVKPLPRYYDFSTLELTAVCHIGFSNVWPIECHKEGQNASLYQIFRRSVERLLRFGHFLIFRDGGRRHLGFLKRQTFNGRTRQEGRTASPCQILSKSLKVRPTYGDFSTFQYGGRRHLGFLNFWYFNGRTLRRAKLHHRAKFRGDPSSRCWDFAILRFFKMAIAAILGSPNLGGT